MITERFNRVIERYPESVALLQGDRKITYQELGLRKAAFGEYLSGSLKLGPGSLIAVSLPNCWEFVAGFLAAAEIGAIFMPLNVQWRAGELRWYAERLPISAAITNRELREPWDRLRDLIPPEAVVAVDEPGLQRKLGTGLWSGQENAAPRRLLTEETALYLTTSGSTGRPRVVPRSHRNLVAGADNVREALGISPGLRFLSVVPFHHAHGFNNCMFLPLVNGATAVLMRKFIPRTLLDLLEQERIQVLIVSPFILSMLVDANPDPRVFSSVEVRLSSGAPMTRVLQALCAERLGIRVRQLYGCSETGTISIESGEVAWEPGAVGRPLGTVEVRTLASDGRQQPANEMGEIAVRSPAVISGYVGEPELNATLFQEGFFRTGDLGRLDQGHNLVITGRAKTMLNVGGVKVDPAEIESVLREVRGVTECRVVGVPDPRQSEIIKALVAVQPGHNLSRSAIVAHCRRHLAEYKIPRVIEFVEGAAVDATGKVPLAWKTERNGVPDS